MGHRVVVAFQVVGVDKYLGFVGVILGGLQ